MKRIFTLILAGSLLTFAANFALAAEPAPAEAAPAVQTEPPAEIIFTAKNGDVAFGHSQHAQSIGDCLACHHNGTENASCHACHDGSQAPSAKNALHKNCKTCHKKEKKGPTSCKACHKK